MLHKINHGRSCKIFKFIHVRGVAIIACIKLLLARLLNFKYCIKYSQWIIIKLGYTELQYQIKYYLTTLCQANSFSNLKYLMMKYVQNIFKWGDHLHFEPKGNTAQRNIFNFIDIRVSFILAHFLECKLKTRQLI